MKALHPAFIITLTLFTSLAVILLDPTLPAARAEDFSWQKPHAKVIPSGDLEWAPQEFEFKPGESLRYIDYENGADTNDGLTAETPWKHHPWDPKATANAAEALGIHTYVFKQGVIYRGRLVAKESGTEGNPIILTRDPSWGEGEAKIYGSRLIEGGWQKASADTVPPFMPEPEKVWYVEIGTEVSPSAIWIDRGEEAQRIEIARHPNWSVSNINNPQEEWLRWDEGTGLRESRSKLVHEEVFGGKPEGFFDGAIIWTDWSGNMGSVVSRKAGEVDPDAGSVQVNTGPARVITGNQFFVENVPGFLDSPGEYFHATEGEFAGRLYLRMPEDADPNEARIEIAQEQTLLHADDQSHIHVSGLHFRFNHTGGYDAESYPAPNRKPTVMRFRGNVKDIAVTNNRFYHVTGAVVAHPRGDRFSHNTYFKDLGKWHEDLMDDIYIADNDISYSSNARTIFVSDGPTIFRALEGPRGRLGQARILRNRLYWTGFRQGPEAFSNIAAIMCSRPMVGEIAGNIIDMSWGSAIFTLSGKKDKYLNFDAPLTRLFIHHNKATNAMLATNDWGGIAYWQGGPIYTYNNISGNVIGYKPSVPLQNDWKTVAYNYYLDGTFKSYTFNNIAWGEFNEVSDPYRSRGPFFVVLGYMNHLFNNSFYKFRHGILGSSGNRSTFMSNVISNITGDFIQQNRAGDTSLRGGGDTGDQGNRGMPTNAYGYNVFFGDNRVGNARGIKGDSVEEWQKQLSALNARLSHTGWKVEGEAFKAPEEHDFTPSPEAVEHIKDRGTKFFVPFGLYKMVGEWNFIHHPQSETLILGENFYMDESFLHRHMYEDVPRNDLSAPEANEADYVEGPLEDWSKGALRFDGEKQFAVLSHADITGSFEYKDPLNERGEQSKGTGTWTEPRETLDMGENSFIIEMVFRAVNGRAGSLVSKMSDSKGYEVALDEAGRIGLLLGGGESSVSRSKSSVTGGEWHHVLIELDRDAQTVRYYIDGKLDAEAEAKISGSLSNEGDFMVGKGVNGFFAGDLDFLRVARGTLADSRTSIEELYAWQFSGPALRDWSGELIADGKRDAGAIEIR